MHQVHDDGPSMVSRAANKEVDRGRGRAKGRERERERQNESDALKIF